MVDMKVDVLVSVPVHLASVRNDGKVLLQCCRSYLYSWPTDEVVVVHTDVVGSHFGGSVVIAHRTDH